MKAQTATKKLYSTVQRVQLQLSKPAPSHSILDDVVIREQSYDDVHTASAKKRIRSIVEEGACRKILLQPHVSP